MRCYIPTGCESRLPFWRHGEREGSAHVRESNFVLAMFIMPFGISDVYTCDCTSDAGVLQWQVGSPFASTWNYLLCLCGVMLGLIGDVEDIQLALIK